MTKLSKQHIILNYLLMCILCLIGMTALIHYTNSKLKNNETASFLMDDNWTITINGKPYTKVRLSQFSFPFAGKNDEIIMEKAIPPVQIPNPVVRIYTFYSTVEMYANGRLEYTYGNDLFENDKTVGSGYHTIPIRNPSQKTNLLIKLTVTVPDAFNSFQPVYVESAENTLVSFFRERLIVLISSAFFIIFGLIMIETAILLFIFDNSIKELFIIGSTSFWIGTVIMCLNGCTLLFIHDYSLNTVIEHVSISMTVISMLLLFYRDITKNTIEKRIYIVFMFLFLVYFIIVLFIDKIPETKPIMISFITIEVIIIIVFSIIHIKNDDSGSVLPAISFIALTVLLVMNFLHNGMLSTSLSAIIKLKGNSLSILTLFALLALIVTLIMKLQENMEKRNYQYHLEEYNRTDFITGFPNKLRYDEMLNEFAEDLKNITAVFAVQLLPAGDNVPPFGVLEADNMLVSFSKILCQVFSDKNLVFTFNTGYFTILTQDKDSAVCNNYQKQLNNLLFDQIQKNPRMQYQLKTGFAFIDGSAGIEATRLAAEKAAGFLV